MEKEATDLMRWRVRSHFSAFFNNGQHWGASKGMGFLMIEEILDEMVTADTFKLMVEEQARAYFQQMLDEQIAYQMRRKAMKAIAKAVKEITE